jgi:DNA-binding transcriptional ArsR family regulator
MRYQLQDAAVDVYRLWHELNGGQRKSTVVPPGQDPRLQRYLSYYLRMHAGNGEARLPDDQTGLMVEVFRMLADPTRVQVLWSLTNREMSVNELAEHVGKPAPSVSQHLAKLRMARLVRTRRDGTTIFYSLENEHVRQLVIDAVFNAEHAGPGVPRHHRDGTGLKAVAESSASPKP